MENDLRNSEGYVDPTPHEAFRRMDALRIRKRGFRPVVYICSPYRGDTAGNTQRARDYCRFAVMKGAIPYAPHLLMPQFMDDGDEEERDLALFMGQVMLDKCAELWVFGTLMSDGMKGEIERAKAKGKKIRYFRQGVFS